MSRKRSRQGRLRLALFIIAASLHALLLYAVVFHLDSVQQEKEPEAGVMKLVDISEYTPPPPPPKREVPPEPVTNTVESVAENMIETDVLPDVVVSESAPPVREAPIEYLSMGKISEKPVFPEDTIIKQTVYPAIARRSNIEGMVYLELFVDKEGEIRDIRVIKEDPAGRGFGEAAINAFHGVRATSPAKSNGLPVAVRYRYPVRFKLK